MPAAPQITLPFPTQIASGQALSAAPVLSDLQHVGSQYNTHTHQMVDVTDLPPAAVLSVPVGGIIAFPSPTSFASQFWYANGATFWVGSWPALATAVGTYWGGNASIGAVPNLLGRAVYGRASGGFSDVATVGNVDALALASRGPKDLITTSTSPFAGGGTGGVTGVSNSGPGFAVMPYLIRAI